MQMKLVWVRLMNPRRHVLALKKAYPPNIRFANSLIRIPEEF